MRRSAGCWAPSTESFWSAPPRTLFRFVRFAYAVHVDTLTGRDLSRKEAARLREALAKPGAAITAGDETVAIGDHLRQALSSIVEELAAGHDVTVSRVDPYLTTGQAAELLHVSRPTVVKLCDEGLLEYEQPGTHRRIRLQSVRAFIDSATQRRAAALAEFAMTESGEDDEVVATR